MEQSEAREVEALPLPAGVEAALLRILLELYAPTLTMHGKSLLRCMIMTSILEHGHGVLRLVILLLKAFTL